MSDFFPKAGDARPASPGKSGDSRSLGIALSRSYLALRLFIELPGRVSSPNVSGTDWTAQWKAPPKRKAVAVPTNLEVIQNGGDTENSSEEKQLFLLPPTCRPLTDWTAQWKAKPLRKLFTFRRTSTFSNRGRLGERG